MTRSHRNTTLPNFFESCPKSLFLKNGVFQKVPKATKYLSFFRNKICCRVFFKSPNLITLAPTNVFFFFLLIIIFKFLEIKCKFLTCRKRSLITTLSFVVRVTGIKPSLCANEHNRDIILAFLGTQD